MTNDNRRYMVGSTKKHAKRTSMTMQLFTQNAACEHDKMVNTGMIYTIMALQRYT